MRERNWRVDDLSLVLIGACVNKEEFKCNGVNYIRNNLELATDLLTLLDSIKQKIQQKIEVNFSRV